MTRRDIRTGCAMLAVLALTACGPDGGFDPDLRGLIGGMDTAPRPELPATAYSVGSSIPISRKARRRSAHSPAKEVVSHCVIATTDPTATVKSQYHR